MADGEVQRTRQSFLFMHFFGLAASTSDDRSVADAMLYRIGHAEISADENIFYRTCDKICAEMGFLAKNRR